MPADTRPAALASAIRDAPRCILNGSIKYDIVDLSLGDKSWVSVI
jgi:hypothetical protein